MNTSTPKRSIPDLVRKLSFFLVLLTVCMISAVSAHADGFPNAYYRGSKVTIPGKVYYCLVMETGLEGAQNASYTSENPAIVKIISQNVWNLDGVPLCIIEGQKIGSTNIIATVTSGSGKRTIRIPIDVINYTNPLKTFKIGSTNLASRFDHSNYASYTGSRGNQTVSYSVASGWTIKVSYGYSDGQNYKTISIPSGSMVNLNEVVSKSYGNIHILLHHGARNISIEDTVIVSDSDYPYTQIPTLSGGPTPTPTPAPSSKLKVTLNGNGSGATVSKTSLTVKKNQKYGTLPTPTRKGYKFQGWYTKASGGSKVTSGTKVTSSKNHTLYAHWKAIQYKIAFQKGNSKATGSMKTLSMTYDKSSKLTKVGFSYKGYKFKGWSKKSGGSVSYKDQQSVKNLTAKDGATVTLYAVWEKNSGSKKITFDANGGSIEGGQIKEVAVQNGKAAKPFPIPFHKNAKFDGWYTKKSGGQRVTSNTVSVNLNSVSKLYAHWTTLSRVISYDSLLSSGYFKVNKFIHKDKNTSTDVFRILKTGQAYYTPHSNGGYFHFYDKNGKTEVRIKLSAFDQKLKGNDAGSLSSTLSSAARGGNTNMTSQIAWFGQNESKGFTFFKTQNEISKATDELVVRITLVDVLSITYVSRKNTDDLGEYAISRAAKVTKNKLRPFIAFTNNMTNKDLTQIQMSGLGTKDSGAKESISKWVKVAKDAKDVGMDFVKVLTTGNPADAWKLMKSLYSLAMDTGGAVEKKSSSYSSREMYLKDGMKYALCSQPYRLYNHGDYFTARAKYMAPSGTAGGRAFNAEVVVGFSDQI